MKRIVFLSIPFAFVIAVAHAVTLDQAMTQTLEGNLRILQAKTGLEAAAGQRLILRSVGLPTGVVGTVAGDQGGHRSRTNTDQPFAFAYGSFRQPIFGAAIPASDRRGEVELLIAQQQLNVAVMEELHKTRIAFYTALYNRSLESLGEAQRERLERNIAGEEARYQAGNGDRAGFVAATLEVTELDPQIETARNAYGKAILQLATAMGHALGPGTKLPSPEGSLNSRSTEFSLQDEIDTALKRRPDLKLARLLTRAASEDQRIVEAGYYPAVDAVASGEAIPVSGVHRESGGSPNPSDDRVSSEVRGGVAYTWRVIDNGQVSGAVSRQRSARQTNELLLQRLEESVPRELSRLQNNLQVIAARYHSLGIAVEVAEKTVASVEENRQQGLASELDVRTAETSLLATRSGILTAMFQQNLALAEWDRTTGRYFQFSDSTDGKVR